MSMPPYSAEIAPSIAELIDRLGHPNRLDRVHASAALVRRCREGNEVVPALIKTLKHDKRVVVRKMVALVLGDLPPQGQEAILALIEVLPDSDEGLRRRAAVALGQFGSLAKSAVPALRLALEDSDEGVRSFAATALAMIDPESVPEQGAA
jgi:HEAT repeat protein